MQQEDEIIVSDVKQAIGNNIVALWNVNRRTRAYQTNHLYVVCDDSSDLRTNYTSKYGTFSIHAAYWCALQLTRDLGKITELGMGKTDLHLPLTSEDHVIYITDDVAMAELEQGVSWHEDEWRKGYYAINSQTSASLVKEFDLYSRAYEDLVTEYQNSRTSGQYNSCFSTWEDLITMMEVVPEHLVIDWFLHDTPLIQQYRHTSPFRSAIHGLPANVYEDHLRYVVNHPDEFPPRPSYDLWLQKTLDKGIRNDFVNRYIPDEILLNDEKRRNLI